MNQILTVEEKKKRENKIKSGRPVEIKGIVRFFSVAVIVFGTIFIGQGSYAIYKDIDDRKPANIPTVTIGRINDKAIVQVNHNTEISKLVYSWNNGERTAIPIGSTSAREEITLLGYDSTLNITIEDVNGKEVKYQKQYLLTGVDITKPSIEIETKDGSNNMVITARDETEIAYMEYQWEGEKPVIVEVEQEKQKEIKKEIPLTVGTKKIRIIAEDTNGNIEKIEKEIVTSTSKPTMLIRRKKQEIAIEAEDKDVCKKM